MLFCGAAMRTVTNAGRPALILALFIVLAHGYFYNGAGWNQGARLGSIFAFVEPGPDQWSFRIDRFLKNPARGITTGDWARAGDIHYSNKAPGTTFLGIPFYFVVFHIERAAGADPTSPPLTLINSYLVSLACGAVWVAVAAAALVRFLVASRGWGAGDALATASILGFATLVFPFDSSLWGHTTAAAFALLGAVFLLRAGRAPEPLASAAAAPAARTAPSAPSARDMALAGFFSGMALLTEYLSGLSLAAASAYVLSSREHRSRAARFFLGAAIPTGALLAYQKLLFGGFFTTATSLQNPGFLGALRGEAMFGAPSPEIAAALLVSLHRGLFVYMPVLVFAIPGAMQLARGRDALDRGLLALCAANALGAILAVSCFKAGWHGGDSAGPRYLIGSIPFWCLLLPRPSSLARPARAAFAAAALVSLANMLVIDATTTMIPSDIANPLFGALYPAVLRNDLAARPQVFNLGALLFGLKGTIALAPLLALLAAWAWLLTRSARSARDVGSARDIGGAHGALPAAPRSGDAATSRAPSPRASAAEPPPADGPG